MQIWRHAPAHTVSTLERVGQGDGDPVAEAGGEVQLSAAARAGGAEAGLHHDQDQHRSSHHAHTVACCTDPVPLSSHSHDALIS